MHRKQFAGCIIIGALTVGALGLGGCGGGGGGELTPADVALAAAVAVAGNQITSVTVQATDAGDSIDITGATARIERADGTSAAVNLTSNPAGTQITLGLAAVTPSGAEFNTLIIDGPVSFTDGATGTTTIIGSLEFQFEVLANGTVVSPTSITVNLPTRGAAADRRVTFTGLNGAAPDYAKTIIRDRTGGTTESRVHEAEANGRIIMRDAQGNITAEVLSGNASRITMMFARTDTDGDGVPDLMEG